MPQTSKSTPSQRSNISRAATLEALGIRRSELTEPIIVPTEDQSLDAIKAFLDGQVITQGASSDSKNPLAADNLREVAKRAPIGFELLEGTKGAEQRQRRLATLAQAFAHTDNPLRADLIRHQRMEHNYDSAHELLEELESDVNNLQEIRFRMDTVNKEIEVLRNNVQEGYYDVALFEHYARLWVASGDEDDSAMS